MRIPGRSPRTLPLLLALLLPVPVPGPAAPAVAGDPVEEALRKEVSPQDALTALKILAGPRFFGRGTGQPGNEDAAKWLAAELRKAGFEPGPVPDSVDAKGKKVEGDFLQWFPVQGRGGKPLPRDRTPNVIAVLRGTGQAPGATATPSDGDPPSPKPGDGEPPERGTGEEGSETSFVAPPAEEYVFLGAHFDHLGIPNFDPDDRRPPKKSSVYWGADDNGSGTTAVLLIARALGRLAEDGLRPRRSVIIGFFSAEEAGLLGSKHYVSAPVFPLRDTVAMINLDMVGRNDTKAMEVYGNTSSPELDTFHREALEDTKFDCTYPSPALLTRSDQWSFYEAKIPILFLHGGLHKDYHTVRDTVEEVNFRKIALIARHAFGILWKTANAEVRPSFREVDMKGAGGKLGLAVDPCTQEEEEALGLDEGTTGVRITNVFAGGVAENLFESGDLIYSWNGFPLYSDDPVGRFQGFVNAARRGDTVVIRLLRGKDRRAVSVKF